VTSVETHLNDVIREWEKKGPAIVEGADVALVRELELLQKFLGPARKLPPQCRHPYDSGASVLREDVYAG
jgi:hypothetical protein